MATIHKNAYYWTILYTDPDTELVIECGNEASWSDLVTWAEANLDKLPPGEGRMVNKRAY